MKLIVCLDDKNGMLFNKRRQSSDRAVCGKILDIAAGKRLLMNAYSGYLFAEMDGNIHICEDLQSVIREDDICFVENMEVLPLLAKATELVVFRWNRVYPADVHFPELPAAFWIQEKADFTGNSHPQITMEVYRR